MRTKASMLSLLVVLATMASPAAPTPTSAVARPRTYTTHVLEQPRWLARPGAFGSYSVVSAREVGPLALEAGDGRLFRGHIEASTSVPTMIEFRAVIRCFGPAGREISRTTTSRNHEGNDAARRLDQRWPGYPRIGYTSRGVLALEVDHVLVAPVSGTYTCRFDGESNPKGGARSRLLALPHQTWLTVSDPHPLDAGARFWKAGDDPGTTLDGPCGLEGKEPTCRFVIPPLARTVACRRESGFGRRAVVFDGLRNRWDPVAIVRPHPLATGATIAVGLEVTGCNLGSGSCLRSVNRCGSEDPSVFAVARTRLEVVPVVAGDGTLRVCGPASFDPPADGGHDGTGSWRSRISLRDHHYKVHHRLRIALDRTALHASCGPDPHLLVRMHLEAIDGQSIKVDGRFMTTAGFLNGA